MSATINNGSRESEDMGPMLLSCFLQESNWLVSGLVKYTTAQSRLYGDCVVQDKPCTVI